MAKVGTSNPDHSISLKRLQCVVENKHKLQYSSELLKRNVKLYTTSCVWCCYFNLVTCHFIPLCLQFLKIKLQIVAASTFDTIVLLILSCW